MSPLPMFALAIGALAGGVALNSDADHRLASQEDAASKGGPAADVTLWRAESIGGTVLAVAGLVGVVMSVVKATE